MAFLTDINNLLGTVVVNNYLNRILTHLTPNTDPYMPYVPVGQWDPTRGLTQTQIRSTGEMPTAMPGAGTALAQNDGTGNADLTATEIAFGRKTRTYALAGWAQSTDAYQVSDFQHDFQVLDFIASQENILRKYQRQLITDWKRQELVGNIDKKVSIVGTGPMDYVEVSNQTARFGGFDDLFSDLPTSPLSWGPLRTLWQILAREGATEYAVGTDELGNPVFPLIAGPTAIASLFRDKESVATAVNYNQQFDNLTVYGRKKAVYGFMPIVDLEIPRFKSDGVDGFTNLYPWVNSTISSGGSGRTYGRNPAYEPDTVASGEAAYEAFYIPTREVMEMHVRPAPGTSFSQAVFKQQNYAGSLQWINNPDMDKNKLGDKGMFYMQNFLASKPGKTDMGYTGLATILG